MIRRRRTLANSGKPSFRDRVARFMYGRYGVDELYKFNLAVLLVFIVLNFFIRSVILQILELALLAWSVFRFFSKNLNARRKENLVYTGIKAKIFKFFRILKAAWRDKKTKLYRPCPRCREVLQIPRTMKGRDIRCPKCGEFFRLK